MEEDFKIADLEIDIPTDMSNFMVAEMRMVIGRLMSYNSGCLGTK